MLRPEVNSQSEPSRIYFSADTKTLSPAEELSRDISARKNTKRGRRIGGAAALAGAVLFSSGIASSARVSEGTIEPSDANQANSYTLRLEPNTLPVSLSELPNGEVVLFEDSSRQSDLPSSALPKETPAEISPDERSFTAVRRDLEEEKSENVSEAKRRRVNRAEAVNDGKPDIFLIMVDDLGYIGDDRVLKRLPNIRKMFIEGGMRFKHMYGEVPLCCPGRANTLTGQHSLHNNVTKNDGDLLNPRSTIAFALQKEGYHTMMTGKYFNRYDGPKAVPGWDRIAMFHRRNERIESNATDWISNAPADKPIFAWLSSTSPHKMNGSFHPSVPEQDRGATECRDIPNFKPPTYKVWDKPKEFPRHMPNWRKGWKLGKICESLLGVDRMVGAVERVQNQRGRPAYYIFVSDNGMSWGQKGFPSKHVPLSTRLPFYVAGPGVNGGAISDTLLSNIDIAPTIAEISGIDLPNDDGKSFLEVLRGNDTHIRQSMLEIMPSMPSNEEWAAIRTDGWRYIEWKDGKKELYNLKRDKWERRNLAKTRKRLARKFDRKLSRLIQNSKH